MRVLAFDTTGGRCACALVENGKTVAVRIEAMRIGHAERLFPQIEDVLAEADCGPRDLDAIAVTTGPGSFSGIRIGIAAARGLALALDISARGVGVLDALAEEAADSQPATVLVANTAPREQLYLQLFQVDPETGAKPASAPVLDSLDCILVQRLEDGSRVAGDAASRVPGEKLVRLPDNGLPNPATLARIAMRLPDSMPPSPLYVRPPDIQPPSTRRRTF